MLTVKLSFFIEVLGMADMDLAMNHTHEYAVKAANTSRMHTDPSITIKQLMEWISRFMVRRGSRDLFRLPDCFDKLKECDIDGSDAVGNSVLPRKKNVGVLLALHSVEACSTKLALALLRQTAKRVLARLKDPEDMDHMDSMVSKLQQRPVPYRGCLGTCKACGRHPRVRPCALNAGHDQTYCICEKCIRGGRPSPSRTGRIDMDNMDSMVLQALDMGLVEEPVVGKPERIDRSWAIVHFQTSADKKAFIENHLEWFDNGYGKEWLPMGMSLW